MYRAGIELELSGRKPTWKNFREIRCCENWSQATVSEALRSFLEAWSRTCAHKFKSLISQKISHGKSCLSHQIKWENFLCKLEKTATRNFIYSLRSRRATFFTGKFERIMLILGVIGEFEPISGGINGYVSRAPKIPASASWTCTEHSSDENFEKK